MYTLTSVCTHSVAPELQPGWFPFVARRGELIIWPTSVPETTTFDVHTVRVLHFACLVDGKPRGEVVWRVNGAAIEVILGPTANVTEARPGRSVLSIGVESNIGILSGTNSVECSAGNVGGVTSGGVITQGVGESHFDQHTPTSPYFVEIFDLS